MNDKDEVPSRLSCEPAEPPRAGCELESSNCLMIQGWASVNLCLLISSSGRSGVLLQPRPSSDDRGPRRTRS
jgi:hypothetical protein